MRARHVGFLLVVALGVVLGYWYSHRSSSTTSPAASKTNPALTPNPPTGPAKVKQNVAIQDQKTIDFSNGKAVVKDSADDKAVIDKAVKEMDDATKDISFGPTTPPAKKTAEPAKTPQK